MAKSKAPTISLCMIVKDEQNMLGQCLSSVQALVNEIVIVDTGSKDSTKQIAQSYKAKLFDFAWTNDFSAARNFSLSKASCDWILILDADEAIDEKDHATVKAHTRYPTHCYKMMQRHYSNDSRLSGFLPVRGQYPAWERNYVGYFESDLVRLIPNKLGLLYREPIHELLEYSLAQRTDLKIVKSPVPLHHYGHTPEVKLHKQKAKLYTSLGQNKFGAAPDSSQAAYELGVEHTNNLRFQEAATAFARALELDPSKNSSWVNYGYVLCELGDLDRARAALERAIKMDANSEEAHCNLGVVFLRAKDAQRAEFYCRRALSIKPDYLNAQSNLAHALAMQGRLAEAAFHFMEILEKAPGLGKTRSELQMIYKLAQEQQRAQIAQNAR